MYIVVVLAIIPIFTKKKPVAKFVNRNTLKEVTIHLKIKKKSRLHGKHVQLHFFRIRTKCVVLKCNNLKHDHYHRRYSTAGERRV